MLGRQIPRIKTCLESHARTRADDAVASSYLGGSGCQLIAHVRRMLDTASGVDSAFFDISPPTLEVGPTISTLDRKSVV